jgi:hypothetical protein
MIKLLEMEHVESAFQFQLEMIKKEVDHLNTSIDKIDTITQNIKYWTIGLWGGAILLTLGKDKDSTLLQGQFLATIVVPILFWFLDGWYRRIQRGFIYRAVQISQFLNSEDFTLSFENQKLTGFHLLDFRGRISGDKSELIKFTSIWKILLFPSVGFFYAGLIVLSVALSIIVS